MPIVYVPRLIESAEQAEALPLGTVSIDFDSQGQPYQASIRVRGGWYCTGEVAADGSPWLAPHDMMTGDTALVPIEAEEEWRASWPEDDAHQRCRDERTARLWADQQDAVAMSRLVTPWEPA